jgi:hypothetical protein
MVISITDRTIDFMVNMLLCVLKLLTFPWLLWLHLLPRFISYYGYFCCYGYVVIKVTSVPWLLWLSARAKSVWFCGNVVCFQQYFQNK